jgi:hypothetical protein
VIAREIGPAAANRRADVPAIWRSTVDNEELDWDDATLDEWLALSNNGDTIPARMLNGMWASLDLRKGTSLGPFYSEGFPEFLFKTSKSHWFI